MKPKILLLLALLLLVACAAPAGNLAPTPTPTLLPPIPADHNGLLYIELPPRGTPEAAPTVVLTAYIIDSVTEAPVAATIYLCDDRNERPPQPGDLGSASATGFVVELPAVLSGRLVVRAVGYHEWNVLLQHRVKTSREMVVPVRLVPETGEEI